MTPTAFIRAAALTSALLLAACAARTDPAAQKPGPPPGAVVTHGLAIPAGHPRLWFDEARLARARAWYQTHPFTPPLSEDSGAGYVDVALRGLLAQDAATCNAAIGWALAKMPQLAYTGGVACDQCRWSGEQIIVVYDWCHDHLTAQQKAQFIAATNSWVGGWRGASWGGPRMYQSNYHWGYLRNELEWAITSYQDNVAFSEQSLDFVFQSRLAGSFDPSTLPGGGSRGGVAFEGSEYGLVMAGYPVIPWQTASLLGRDLFTETDFFREEVYAILHATTPAATQVTGTTGTGFTFFPFSDDEAWNDRYLVNHFTCDWMMTVANRWPTRNIGRHARQWLATTGSSGACTRHVQAVDVPNTPLPFDDLPLDYFASGPGYLFGRSGWAQPATHFLFQGADLDGMAIGHQHADYGTFQIWRDGRYLSRETTSYTDLIAGFAGTGTLDAAHGVGHNVVVVDGATLGSSNNPGPQYTDSPPHATVERLESHPAYAYVATDLSAPASRMSVWRRELVFVRALETFVVFDRLETAAASAVKTFLNHCETQPALSGNDGATCTNGSQALVMTTLAPATRAYRTVAEGGRVGQWRIEVDTSPGTARSYILTVLQAKDAGAASLAPSASEDATSFTVTLDAGHVLVFQKGMTSSGGSITVAGVTTGFRAGVQTMSVSEDGPAWGP